MIIESEVKIMNITIATKSDAEDVMALYHSLIGTYGCTWNENYPNIDDINENIKVQSLYISRDENGELIAAAGCAVEEEQVSLDFWDKSIKNPCGLFRVAVRHDLQGKGLGEALVRHIMNEARLKGFDGILLLVSPSNPAALRLYSKCGFRKCGECDLYDMHWHCYEVSLLKPE